MYEFPVIEDEATCWFVSQHADPVVRAFAAASKFADESTFGPLLEDDQRLVVEAVLNNPLFPLVPEMSASARSNDRMVAGILAGLTPPPREVVLWLYHHGGQETKHAARNVIAADRIGLLAALRNEDLNEWDVNHCLGKGILTAADHRSLVPDSMLAVRKWLASNSRDTALLAELMNDDDEWVSGRAVERSRYLSEGQSAATLFG